ncbi:hypothetical protein HZS_4816, partial [Henneguya salminicola]
CHQPRAGDKKTTAFFRRLGIGNIPGQYHTILMWATTESLALLRYNYHTFIDSTFQGPPHLFIHCLTFMAYDHNT